jgi:hypothetical protein
MLSPSSGLKSFGWKVKGFYRFRGRKAEVIRQIRDKNYGKRFGTNRETSSRSRRMSPRNVGVDLRNYTASKSKTTARSY